MLLRRILVLPAALLLALAAPAQQKSGALDRLAGEQLQLAEQARRLDRVLAALEQRDRDAGNSTRAELLAGARAKLSQAGSAGDLAAVLESVASELSSERAGAAMESQTEVIQLLQDVLNYLLQQEMADQMDALRKDAAERRAALDAFVRAQAELLQRTQEMLGLARGDRAGENTPQTGEQNGEQAGKQDDPQHGQPDGKQNGQKDGQQPGQKDGQPAGKPDGKPEDPQGGEPQRGGSAEQKSAAAQQRELSQKVQEFTEQERLQGRDSRDTQQAAQAGQDAADALDPENQGAQDSPQPGSTPQQDPAQQPGENPQQPPDAQGQRSPGQQQQQQQRNGQRPQQQSRNEQERLQEAQRKQQEALDRLKDAAEQARKDEQQLNQMQQMQDLLDLASEAASLLERHQRIMSPFLELAAKASEEEPLPRSERGRMREWSDAELAIGVDAGALNVEVLERGADTVPFLLGALRQDHERFGKRLGPPDYRVDPSQRLLGEQITHNWNQLIEALKAEAERLRRNMQPGQPQDGQPPQEQQQPSPLVSLIGELELLKRMEQDQRDRMDALNQRRQILAQRGFELDEDDRSELDDLVERQARLRRLYEAILERLKEEGQQAPPTGEDTPKPEGA